MRAAGPAEGELVLLLCIAEVLGIERFHLVGHDWGGAVAWVTTSRA